MSHRHLRAHFTCLQLIIHRFQVVTSEYEETTSVQGVSPTASFNAKSLTCQMEFDFLGFGTYRFFARSPSGTHRYADLSFPGHLIVVGHPSVFEVVDDITCGLCVYRPTQSMKDLWDVKLTASMILTRLLTSHCDTKFTIAPAKKSVPGLYRVTYWRRMIRHIACLETISIVEVRHRIKL